MKESPLSLLIIYSGQITPDSGAGGTVWQSAKALRELGHRVDVVGGDELERRISHNKLHYAVELPRRILRVVQKRMAAERYDALIISQPYGYLAGQFLRGMKNAPLYLHRSHGHELALAETAKLYPEAEREVPSGLHRIVGILLSACMNRQARLALRYADGTVVPCLSDYEYLVERERGSPQYIRVIPHAPVDCYRSTPVREFTRERHQRLLYVGNVIPRKGEKNLFRSSREILTSIPTATLTIVTAGRDHERIRSELGPQVAGKLTLMEWMPQERLLEIYDEHGVLLITSLYEGASKVHYEGMTRGLCVVATAVGATCDTLISGHNGWLVPPGDTVGFTATCEAVLRDFEGSQRVAGHARETVMAYSWQRNAQGIVDFIRELAARKAGA